MDRPIIARTEDGITPEEFLTQNANCRDELLIFGAIILGNTSEVSIEGSPHRGTHNPYEDTIIITEMPIINAPELQSRFYRIVCNGALWKIHEYPSANVINTFLADMGYDVGKDKFEHVNGLPAQSQFTADTYTENFAINRYPRSIGSRLYFGHDRGMAHAAGVILMPTSIKDAITDASLASSNVQLLTYAIDIATHRIGNSCIKAYEHSKVVKKNETQIKPRSINPNYPLIFSPYKTRKYRSDIFDEFDDMKERWVKLKAQRTLAKNDMTIAA